MLPLPTDLKFCDIDAEGRYCDTVQQRIQCRVALSPSVTSVRWMTMFALLPHKSRCKID
jgi:hypothetical protein